ncbi:hypothetical protein DPMN_164499, partial [Dreissena polymorpha]
IRIEWDNMSGIVIDPDSMFPMSDDVHTEYRNVDIVLSHYHIVALWILMCNHDCPNGIRHVHVFNPENIVRDMHKSSVAVVVVVVGVVVMVVLVVVIF